MPTAPTETRLQCLFARSSTHSSMVNQAMRYEYRHSAQQLLHLDQAGFAQDLWNVCLEHEQRFYAVLRCKMSKLTLQDVDCPTE